PMLQQSLNLHTWADHLHFHLGRAYLESGDYASAIHHLTLATQLQQHHTTGIAIELPKQYRANALVCLALAEFMQQHNSPAAVQHFAEAMTLDASAIIQLLTATTRHINPKLTPLNPNPPDMFLTMISKTRRDLL